MLKVRCAAGEMDKLSLSKKNYYISMIIVKLLLTLVERLWFEATAMFM